MHELGVLYSGRAMARGLLFELADYAVRDC